MLRAEGLGHFTAAEACAGSVGLPNWMIGGWRIDEVEAWLRTWEEDEERRTSLQGGGFSGGGSSS